jgi:universal stress protein A
MLHIGTILHPTDFSADSEHAFHLACSLARDHGGRIIVVHVTEPPETVMGEFGLVPTDPEEDVEDSQERLQQIQSPDPAVTIERELCEGDPSSQILAAARESRCDLIVMGTHGHSALREALMGSVAEEVVRHAACAVLTVKTPVPVTA